MNTDLHDVDALLEELIDGWCARRVLRPLRELLPCYPRTSGLTDEWALLASSLKTIRIQCSEDLVTDELERVVQLQQLAESMAYR